MANFRRPRMQDGAVHPSQCVGAVAVGCGGQQQGQGRAGETAHPVVHPGRCATHHLYTTEQF